MNIYNDTVINKSCTSYVDGLIWITDYYFNKTSKSMWFYQFNYSPTLLDIYNYLEVNKEHLYKHSNYESMTINSDLQLLMILPSLSKDTLPVELQPLMNKNSPIGYFYPSTFKIQSFLKTKLHECFPILPDFNIDELNLAYLNIIS
jgi:5'-3' exonuclease